ncbi:beta-galactosidase [Paenibacillus silviterrae]|uniref:beta-galactosidase n=1 Tax=Paenibacillus silviterrae TaxID=3242194 RepID=UPI0025437FFA|nr:beta-galactosidase [Paenibacillus chinjuensis]
MLYGSCYYPEHREPGEWEEDLRLMMNAGFNAVRIGEFAWKQFEPAEGTYDFSWLDRFIQLAGNHSVKVVLCPPMRTIPAWLYETSPSLMIETSEGHRLEFASRYTFCINHSLLRAKSGDLASALAARYGDNPLVIGWHLDNEIGDEPDCHCSVCKSKWNQWLQAKYGTIEALNSAWGTIFWSMEFNHFEQIPTPRITKADYNPSFLQAWREFRSECNIDAVRLLGGAIRPHIRANQYITTNNQMFWNHRTDYYRMAEYLDITGTNYYPPFGDRNQALSFGLAANRSFKKAPFHVYELRNEGHSILGAENNTPAPGELERLTMHTIANGADAVFYFPWKRFPFGSEQNHGAITDFNGKPTRMYEECRHIGGRLHDLGPCITGSLVPSDIAVLYDFPSRWHLEHPSGWTGDTGVYLRQINQLYHTVRKLGYNCDAVGRYGDFSAYKLLLVPMLPIVDDGLVAKLQQYVMSGGFIVFHPMCGIKNTDACYYPDRLHPGMLQLLGSRTAEVITTGPQNHVLFHWNKRSYTCGLFHEVIEPLTAQPEGYFINQWYEGNPAVTRHSFGKGQSWFIATFAEEMFYRDLVTYLCQEIGISPILGITPPEGIEITMRQSNQGTRYVFVINGGSKEIELPLPNETPMVDIWNREEISGVVTLKPLQVRVLLDRKGN